MWQNALHHSPGLPRRKTKAKTAKDVQRTLSTEAINPQSVDPMQDQIQLEAKAKFLPTRQDQPIKLPVNQSFYWSLMMSAWYTCPINLLTSLCCILLCIRGRSTYTIYIPPRAVCAPEQSTICPWTQDNPFLWTVCSWKQYHMLSTALLGCPFL